MKKVIDLNGPNGNVFAIIAITKRSMQQLGCAEEVIDSTLSTMLNAHSYDAVLDLFEERLGEYYELKNRRS